MYAKNERQVNSNLPCKFGHFWRKLNFWGAVWTCLGACGAQTRYDVIWNFVPIIFCRSLRIFYVNMATSEGGGGLQIFNCDRAIISAYLLIISAYLLIISASSFFFTHQVTGGTRYITVTFIDPWKLQNGADSSRELLLKPLGTMLPWCSKGFRRTLNCSPMMTRGTAFSGDLNL